jgi:glycosyltransferase involved in cell wall biosynthesis
MWLLEQVRSLQQRGVEFEVVHFNPKDTYLNYLVGLQQLIRRLRADRYDLVHVHHTYTCLLTYVAGLLAAAPLPTVLTIHEQDLLKTRRKRSRFSPLGFLRSSVLLRRLATSKASFVIFVSRDLLEAVSPRVPAEVIPCGVDLDKFRPLDREACRRQLGIPVDATVVFFPADAKIERKRIGLAQAAWRALTPSLRASARLVVGGEIPHAQMPLYYGAADAVLQTALLEGSPTIVKEALACEVPIVSTDCGDTRDMVEGVPHCFVCNDDAESLAGHLQLALTHRATGGRQRIRQMGLALDQVADRVMRVYGRVLSSAISAVEAMTRKPL